MGQTGQEGKNTPTMLNQLRNALLEEWNNILMRKINTLMNSMHRRIREENIPGTENLTPIWIYAFVGYRQIGSNNSKSKDQNPVKFSELIHER